MWNKINNHNDIYTFMEQMNYFHDSCIKEMKYVSGSYVNNDYSMHPIDDKKRLYVVFQSQNSKNPMVEIIFDKLVFMKLFPFDENYTSEIHGAQLFIKNNYFYWVNDEDVQFDDLNEFEGVSICSRSVSWRMIKNSMGNNDFYLPVI